MRSLLVLAFAACGSIPAAHEPGALAGALPAEFIVADPIEGGGAVANIRVWVAGDAFADPGARARLTEEIDAAGQVLQPLLGLRLEVTEVRAWPIAVGAEVGDGLAELSRRDPGEDAAWVIGVLPPPEAPRVAMTELVAAEPLARHVVMRAWNEAGEAANLRARFPQRSAAAEAELLGAHRRHKQAVALLYGLARTLGAIDEREPSAIVHPRYGPTQTRVAARNRELMRGVLAARLAGNVELAVLAGDLLAQLEGAPWGGWLDGDRDARAQLLRQVIAAAQATATVGAIPPAAMAQAERVRALRARGDLAGATAELDPLLAAFPANAALRLLACELTLAGDVPLAPLPAPCQRAHELAPADAIVFVRVGQAAAKRGDADTAHAAVQVAAGMLQARPPVDPQRWAEVLSIYRSLGALSWADALLTATGLDDAATRAWIGQTRARFGAPAGAAPPAEEGALVEAVKAALAQINASAFADAARDLTAAEARWPNAPGLAAMRCELAFRQERFADARRACEAAIARAPGTSWAQYLLGILRLRGKARVDTDAGVAHLRAAIDADPDLGQAWRALGKALRRRGETAALAELDAAHQARFGRPL